MHPTRSLSLYEFLSSLGMGMSATTGSLLQLKVGMSVSDIALVNIIFWITIILMELPTGMLADGKSRIWSIRIGITLFAIGCFAYANVRGVRSALLGEVMIGTGMAFLSGAEEAWLADALKKRGEELVLSKAFGTLAMASASGILIGGLIGSVLGMLWLRLAWIGAGVCVSASAFVAWRIMDDAGEIDDRAKEIEALHLSWQALRTQPALLWSVAATAIFGLVVAFNHLWQPFFTQDVGQARLGAVWMIIQGSFLAAGWYVRRRGISEGKTATHSLLFALLLTGMGLIAIGAFSKTSIALFCLSVHEFGRGLFRPIMTAYTQARIESRYRATFGSMQSLLGKTGCALALVLVWHLAKDKETTKEMIVFIWTIVGTLLLIGTIVLWKFRPKEP